MELPKIYYLPAYRSVSIGIILILVGVCISLMGIDLKRSIWYNLQWIFLSFDGVFNFIVSVIMLAFKVGFIAGGYIFIRYATGIERAKLDNKGFYYRDIPTGSSMSKIAMDAGPLTFVPYHAIDDIHLKNSFFSGLQLVIALQKRLITLTALGVLSKQEKQEIADTIKSRIKRNALNIGNS